MYKILIPKPNLTQESVISEELGIIDTYYNYLNYTIESNINYRK